MSPGAFSPRPPPSPEPSPSHGPHPTWSRSSPERHHSIHLGRRISCPLASPSSHPPAAGECHLALFWPESWKVPFVIGAIFQ